ncbi:hypothetical protein KVR01_011131 [Diaporthe batatas]|uniref:uncharacterized protein n=1 Tax=Diaporthe batatas TaxID=748121 RepID=UPI001D04C6EA|nr:uncharacterized protein KVR01_011131 [Diaporthe batatas]KAG8159470.1 hypothetical protein KVR01_011131 [Diaporthe batatas]
MKPALSLTSIIAVAAHVTAEVQHGRVQEYRPATCTPDTAIQRKEYGSMADHEKLSYIHGVQCLMRLPSQYPTGVVPAATSRWLDFTATHINQSLNIHLSGLLLPWHRHFLYLVEQALQQDCGYPKSLGIPYWDYPLYPSLADSPIFDGSHTSLGSNGRATDLCIEKGPFSNSTINFGPFTSRVTLNITLPTDWQESKPGCIQRQFRNEALQENNNQSNIDSLLASPDIYTVLRWFNGAGILNGFVVRGIHGAGHFAVGGTASDFFASSQDPAFFLHHSQIDRLWAGWQDRHPELRYTYNGTSTIFNPPGVTPEVDNTTVMSFGAVGDSITVGETADPMGLTPYCYVYS